MQRQLTVYVRRGCHLCTDMTRALLRLQPDLAFDVREVDVDHEPGLAERYGDRVPVLVGDGTELCHYFLDERRLRAWCAGR